jgi:beta-lactamase superfamily II metal-dependent hydrolase
MTEIKYIDEDLLKVYKFGEKRDPENLLTTLFWGDNVKVVEKSGNVWKLDFSRQVWNEAANKPEWKQIYGQIPDKTHFLEKPILKIRFVDCGQGDAAIIESPQGKIVFLDGGENLDLTHYVSAAWAHILRSKPLETETIVVTHGDADHFSGLTKLLQRTRGNKEPILSIKRVYHNGLVKAPESVAKASTFGVTKKKDDTVYITDLVDDVRTVPNSRLNTPFREWKETLNMLTAKKPDIEMKRIAYGDNNCFNFLDDEGIKIQVLGPIVEDVDGSPALRYFQGPKGGLLPSETINGHSIVLKLTYGNVRVLFGADLNTESETNLLTRANEAGISLAAEILKVPHHGSADFDPKMLKAVSPAVSVISSGDENESTEYIHPRAGLVGALGKYSNPAVERPLIYVTEMVAFFKRIGRAKIVRLDAKTEKDKEPFEVTNAYNKTVFGIVHIRTDGKRVLVVTHSGTPNKESYAFKVDNQGRIEFEENIRIL